MSWDWYVLRGDPADLAPGRSHRLDALDQAVVGEVLGDDDAWMADTLVAELDASPDVDGAVRYAAASVRFDDVGADAVERQRSEYRDLLLRLVTLAERTGGRLWDPQRESFVERSGVDDVVAALPH